MSKRFSKNIPENFWQQNFLENKISIEKKEQNKQQISTFWLGPMRPNVAAEGSSPLL